MKKACKILKNGAIIAYIILIIFVTICLLSYNDYKLAVIDGNTFIPVIDDDLEPKCKKGDLLIVEKNKLSSVKEGDMVFFYRVQAGETVINFAEIREVERVSETEYTYTIDGEYKFSSSNFIGKVDTAKTISKVGTFLGVLQSKWGFLFLGVFPTLMAFLYTLYTVVLEVQVPEEEEKKANSNKIKKDKPKEPEKINENVKEENKKIDKVEKEVDKKSEKTQIEKQENKEEIKNENIVLEEKKEEVKSEETKEEEDLKEKEETKLEIKEEKIEEAKKEEKPKTEEEKRKALIEEKMNSLTEEQKRALIQAKLNSMTEEQKRALIEAKRKKMEAEKNKNIGG